jgi:hypothetical protein
MQNVFTYSSYGVVGFYIGGATINMVCPSHAPFHDAAWVNAVYAQGWNLQPIYDGVQSPCTGSTYTHSTNPTTARNTGILEGQNASAAASSRGITAGSIIYYDYEGSLSTGNCTSIPATQAFLSGWAAGVNNAGYSAGIYSGTCTFQYLTATNASSISIAQYNGLSSVYSVSSCLSSTLWNLNQRSHQYAGPHSENYNGTVISIDTSCYDERVAGGHTHSMNTACL